MRLISLFAILALSACAAVSGPDPRDGFTERNVGQTVVTYVDGLGTQAVYMAPGGALHLWSSAQAGVQKGAWRYDILATGRATTYQGAGGINHPVEELETQWGVCFQYRDEAGNIMRRPAGGDWNCALLTDYEALIIDRVPGDRFGLGSGRAPAPMPAGQRLSAPALAAL